jgi:thioesterase domain-containing protein/acyl carrier protein
MSQFNPTWYTAVPTIHQAVVVQAEQNRETIKKCRLRFIRSCSAALPPSLMMELESNFDTPVLEAYGMTEASHQMCSNPLPPRARKPGSVGVAAGPEVGIMDEKGNLLPSGQTGEIVVRGPNVTKGYENNPTANENSFTNGWFRTGDQGSIDSEGYVFINGRLKEIINRGGEKISPREIDEVLMEHPSIAQVVTFALPHSTLGEEVAAAVVLRENADTSEEQIRQFAASRLADFKTPRRVVILNEIPKGPTGKLQRIGLADKLGITARVEGLSGPETGSTSPRDEVESQLAEIWQKILAVKRVGITDNFFDLGGDSLSAVQLFAAIETVTGKNLPLSTLLKAMTIESLANILRSEESGASWSSLVPIQPAGSRFPFFCVHAVGANVLGYRALASHLGVDQPFYGLQSQGLDGKQPPQTRIEEMATHYIEEIRSLQPEGPYFIGGGSSGGVVAFEMARQLEEQGQKVGLVALLDTYGVGHSSYIPDPALFSSTLYPVFQGLDSRLGTLMLFGPKRGLSCILRELKTTIQSKFTRTEQGLAATIHRVREANREAITHYKPQFYSGRVTLFLANEDTSRAFTDSRLVWSELAAEAEIRIVPGNHDSFIKEPHVSVLAQQLRSCLQRAQAIASSSFTRGHRRRNLA